MPNIAITSYCNLSCPYCFANDMINTNNEKNIQIDTFRKILNWLSSDFSQNIENRIGIIGGEPTLHPQFSEILEIVDTFCTQYNSSSILFTNGIQLKKYLQEIPKSMYLLINANDPKNMKGDQHEKFIATLDKMYQLGWFLHKNAAKNCKATLGCNLCMEIDDYTFFWDLVEKYDLKLVRVSVTAPTKEEYKKDKHKYFAAMKSKFIDFMQKAREHRIQVTLDCSQIPSCYFSDIELRLINNYSTKPLDKGLCRPVVDITADFTASACFGAYETVDCNNFASFSNLRDYLLYTKVVPKTLANTAGKCKDCIQHETLFCQGGCLGFSDEIKNDNK